MTVQSPFILFGALSMLTALGLRPFVPEQSREAVAAIGIVGVVAIISGSLVGLLQ